ncbi:MAG: type II and III secretion system protein family protein, partial [Pseudomonadota bacterium]
MKPTRTFIRAQILAVALGATPFAAFAQGATDKDPLGVETTEAGQTGVSRVLKLGVNKSVFLDLDRPAADIIITNPEIADATVQTANRIIFRGVEVGETNAFVFDAQGRPLVNLEISVDVDTAALNQMIERYVPDARVTVEAANSNLVVSGSVDSLIQSDQVLRLINAYLPAAGVGGAETAIINMMSVRAKDQVMLEVRIVEMQRTLIKQLGINLSGTSSFGDLASEALGPVFGADGFPQFFEPDTVETIIGDDGSVTQITIPGLGLNSVGVGNQLEAIQAATPFSNRFGFSSANNFNVAGQALGGLNTELGYSNFNGSSLQTSAGAAIDALERIGVVRTLAEPNIMAVSGEAANFLAGGEFPVPVARDIDGISVEFKPYGVGLAFTPTVLSEGRISLKIATEISELSNQGAFQGQAGLSVDQNGELIPIPGLTIPALVVRRAESVVELPSGGTTMLAGLIQSRSRQTLDQLPGVKKLPILGALFQSRDFENQETELVVIITPYLVEPGAKGEFKTPADGYVVASDPQTIFFGKLNDQYAEAGEGLTE